MFKETTRSGWGMYSLVLFTVLYMLGYDSASLAELPELNNMSIEMLVSLVIWIWGTIFRGDTAFGFWRV